ncbi:MAG TPA: RNA polymerase sigma factor [Planctomycetota bacterium]|nr:RNA polymerase sigma factor [Planctomycetota bacterium]
MDDEALVRRHLRGDPEAFRALYERYRDRVFATAWRILGEYHAAADAVQEVFVKLHGELGRFKFESKFSTWLFRVAVNHALNRAEEAARRARLRERAAGDGRAGPPSGEGRPLDETVARAVARLSPKLRAVVGLRYLEGLSYEEIAEVLELSVGTVKSRLFAAHEALRALLGETRREDEE